MSIRCFPDLRINSPARSRIFSFARVSIRRATALFKAAIRVARPSTAEKEHLAAGLVMRTRLCKGIDDRTECGFQHPLIEARPDGTEERTGRDAQALAFRKKLNGFASRLGT